MSRGGIFSACMFLVAAGVFTSGCGGGQPAPPTTSPAPAGTEVSLQSDKVEPSLTAKTPERSEGSLPPLPGDGGAPPPTAPPADPAPTSFAPPSFKTDEVKAPPAALPPAGQIVPPPAIKPLFIESKVVTQKYDNGKPRVEAHMNVYAGMPERLEGNYQEWHPNGKLWRQGAYKDDRREGPWKFWSENGTVAKSGTFKGGAAEGPWVFHRADGTLSREEGWREGRRHGIWKYYDSTGTRVVQQQEYKDNVPNGTWTTWHGNGQKSTEEQYQDGQRHGTQSSWYDNGKQRVSVEFRNGKQHGKLIRWDSSGRKIDEKNFKDGEPADN